MGSQDQHRNSKYQDPTGEVPQYSLTYLRQLRNEDPDQMLTLWRAGNFREAIAEEAANKAASRTYTRNKGVQAAGSMKSQEAKQEREQQESQAAREAKRQKALAQLRAMGVNPEDL